MIDENLLINKLDKIKNKLINSNKLIANDKGYFVEKIIEIVKNEPKVGEWIPVEERLPEEQTDYKGIKRSSYHLVTVIAYGKPKISIDYIVNGIWHLEEGNTVLKVSAWKPLPEPYRVQLEKNSKGGVHNA